MLSFGTGCFGPNWDAIMITSPSSETHISCALNRKVRGTSFAIMMELFIFGKDGVYDGAVCPVGQGVFVI